MTVCLVTGGAGFIGSHIVDALVARGNTVRVLDNLSTGHLENLFEVMDEIEFIKGDIRSESMVQEATAGADLVFINRTETLWDHIATVIFRENAGDVMREIVERFKKSLE